MSTPTIGVISAVLMTAALSYGLLFGLFPQSIGVLAVALLLIGASSSYLVVIDIPRYRPGYTLVWVLFAAVVSLSSALSGDALKGPSVGLVLSLLLLFFSVFDSSWLGPSLWVFGALSSIHVLATIVFYFQPQLYFSQIKASVYPDVVEATGYASGLTPHYSYNGTYISFAAILLFCWAMWRLQDGLPLQLELIALFLALFALILTGKRAHILITLFACLVIYLLVGTRGKFVKLVTGTLGVVLTLPVVGSRLPGVGESLERLVDSVSATSAAELTTGRTFLWEHAIEGWKDSPIWGNGWNSFIYLWPTGQESTHAHNEVFQLLYSSGIVGTSVALVAVTASYKTAIDVLRNWDANSHSDRRFLVSLVAVGGQTFSIIYGFTTGTLFSTSFTFIPYLYFVALGFAVRFTQVPQRKVLNRKIYR